MPGKQQDLIDRESPAEQKLERWWGKPDGLVLLGGDGGSGGGGEEVEGV